MYPNYSLPVCLGREVPFEIGLDISSVSHHLPTMLAPHGNAISFLAKIWVAHLVNLRYEVRYESGNISGKVCRKLLAFQQVLWMDRPTRHVGGWECPGRWWWGKPVAHLCQLSALLKADQCVSG